MAITTNYCTGFECGLVNSAGGSGTTNFPGGLGDALSAGTAAASATNPRTGTYCLAVGSGSAGSHQWVKYWINTTRLKVFRCGLRITEAPDAETQHISFGLASSATTTALYITVDNSLVMRIRNNTAGTTQTVGTLTLNTWHLVEAQYDSSANPHSLKVKLDGAASVSHTLAVAAADTTMLRLGGLTTFTGIARYDDVVVGDFTDTTNDWYSDGYGLSLYPGSDGSHSFTANDFSTGDAGTQRAPSYTDFYLMVDEPPIWSITRSTTDNIAQRVVRDGYVEIAPAAADSSKPPANGVWAVLAYSGGSATTNNAGCVVRNSAGTSTTIWGFTGALADYSETTNFFKGAVVTKPAGGWTETEIEAVRWRFGYSSDISPVPTAQMLMLEVDYPVAVAAVIPDLNMAPMRAP